MVGYKQYPNLNITREQDRDNTHILMTSVRKDDDWESSHGGDRSCPAENADGATLRECVAFDIVSDHENDQICNRAKSDDAGVLQRIQSAQER